MARLLFVLVSWAACWKLYQKMGKQGWEGIVPFYNTYILFDLLYGNGWKMLLLLIPFVNLYIGIKLFIDLAKAFNLGIGFALGLIFLNPIFMCILAFGKAEYQLGSRAIEG